MKNGNKSLEVEKKINDQKSWFPLRKDLKNYTKSFGIKIINKNEPIILNTYSVKQPDLYYFETIKMTSQT